MSDPVTVCERLGDRAGPWIRQAPFSMLLGCFLEFRCGCGNSVVSSVRLAAQRLGDTHRLGDVVDRVICRRCSQHYSYVYLNERHHREPSMGPVPGWSVQLVPLLVIEAEAAE